MWVLPIVWVVHHLVDVSEKPCSFRNVISAQLDGPLGFPGDASKGKAN